MVLCPATMWCLLPSSHGRTPRPSGGGLRACLVLEAQLGSPVGPGSCFSVFFSVNTLYTVWTPGELGFSTASVRDPTLAGLAALEFLSRGPLLQILE